MKRKIILALAFGVLAQLSFAQIGGLSAGKLGSFSAGSVPEKAIEFEPAMGVSWSKNIFDSTGDKSSIFSTNDSLSFSNGFSFRFTYGVFTNAEIGAIVSPDMSEFQTGVKYQVFEKEASAITLMSGFNFSFDDQINSDEIMSYSGGIIYSYENSWALDFNAQFSRSFTSENAYTGYFLSTDIGHYFNDNIQFVSGIYYSRGFYPNEIDDDELLTFMTGLTIENAENFLLVLNYAYDIMGMNVYQANGIGLALTIMID